MMSPPAHIHAMPVQDNPQLQANSRPLAGSTRCFMDAAR
jgi:hypothetical protein